MKRGVYKIEAEGADITAIIKDRFIDLTITDAAGKDSDNFRLTLDNRDDELEFPATGAKLKIWIGLEGDLVYKGEYSVDEVTEFLDDGHLEITGRASDMTGPIKTQKTMTWEAPLTIGDMANTIAIESGYSCQVHPAIASISIGHQNQKAESDLNLLTRICEAHSALMKLGGGYLLIVPKAGNEAANGASLGEVVIDDPSESSGRVTIQERGTHKAVMASYFDQAAQQTVNVVYGDKDAKPLELKGKCKDEAEALAKARAKFEESARGRAEMTLDRPLTPQIVSPGRVRVVGHRQSANGLWQVESATHSVGSSGYSKTSLQLKTIEHEASKKKGGKTK
ncbi:MAG: phage late control D family protein [Aeromonas veronii]